MGSRIAARHQSDDSLPTEESLLVEVARVEPLMKPVEDLVASFPTDDAAQRLAALVGTMMPALPRQSPGAFWRDGEEPRREHVDHRRAARHSPRG